MKFIIVYITHANEAAAKKVANHLIEKKIVACSNIFPITSAYWWNGSINNDEEFVSIVKTKTEHWDLVKETVAEIHPYEVPCIMKIEAEANEAYARWIEKCVQK